MTGFLVQAGKVKNINLPVTPSTPFLENDLVTFTSGKLVRATSSTAPVDIVGAIGRTIASTDADYATDRMVVVRVPMEKHVEFLAPVTTGTIAATDIGTEFDLTDSEGVNASASSVKVVKLIRVISSTIGLFFVKLNGSY